MTLTHNKDSAQPDFVAPGPGKRENEVESDAVSNEDSIKNIVISTNGLVVRFARSQEELNAVQHLRYLTFFSSKDKDVPDDVTKVKQLVDGYDDYAHTLVVFDTESTDGVHITGSGRIVGTYRVITDQLAKRHNGFVCDNEFDIWPSMQRNPDEKFVELSRALVIPEYRSRNVMALMWGFIVALCDHGSIEVLFGCASFDTTDVASIAPQLALLARTYSAPTQWTAKAVPERYIAMDPSGGSLALPSIRSLPPLLRGYLGLGAYIGEGAVIDPEFGTIDVLIIVRISKVPESMIARLRSY